MKKFIALLVLLAFFATDGKAQTKLVRSKSIGVSFIMKDFVTPQRIRSSSLSTVLKDKQFAKLKEMSPGLAIHYFKGFTPHIDFAATIGGCYVKMPLEGKTFERDHFLLELDASANFKMLTEAATVNPYLTAGIGASKYTDIYGAFIPLGAGIKGNFVSETQIFLQIQYRIPVTTESIAYHFQFSFGVSGLLSKKKA